MLFASYDLVMRRNSADINGDLQLEMPTYS